MMLGTSMKVQFSEWRKGEALHNAIERNSSKDLKLSLTLFSCLSSAVVLFRGRSLRWPGRGDGEDEGVILEHDAAATPSLSVRGVPLHQLQPLAPEAAPDDPHWREAVQVPPLPHDLCSKAQHGDPHANSHG